jgi:hypothetical protein
LRVLQINLLNQIQTKVVRLREIKIRRRNLQRIKTRVVFLIRIQIILKEKKRIRKQRA